MQKEEIWWIDTDAGVDDAAAIIVAIQQKKKIVGISTCFGNTTLENVNKNVCKTLEICEYRTPVYPGCRGPLTSNYTPPSDGYFGHDGLGDVKEYESLTNYYDLIKEEKGALALIRVSKEYEGKAKLKLVVLGPVTNLALAIKLDPSLKDRIDEVYTMGGTYTGHGIMNMCTEFNWHLDPEAAHVFLNGYDRITIVPMECAWPARMTPEQAIKYRSAPTKVGKFLRETSRVIIKDKNDNNTFLDAVYDAVCMILAVDNSLITKYEDAEVTIDLVGEYTKGTLAVYWEKENMNHDEYHGSKYEMDHEKKPIRKRSRIVMDIDGPKVIQMHIDSVYNLK